jgi:transcription initiation factor TFIIIB Brf1 subunit/transcription initiation factor TFIIB
MDTSDELIEESWNDYFSHLDLNKNETGENDIQKCKNCNNSNLYTMNGDITCTVCGLIFEAGIISKEAEWNNYSEEGVMKSNGIRCGNVLDYTNPYDTASNFIPRFMWSWHFDDQGVKRYTNLSKIAIRCSYSSKQRAFDEAKYSFEKIQSILILSDSVFNMCKLFWGIVLKTDILKRGGNRRGVKACCVFYACLSEKQQRNREEIASAFDILSTTDFTKGEKIFREIFEKNTDFSWILFKGSENESMYSRYINQLSLPYRVNKLMCIVKEHTKDHLLGIAAKSEVAGLLFFICKDHLNLKHPNKSEIAKCIGICNPTLNKVIEIIRFFYIKNPELKKIII